MKFSDEKQKQKAQEQFSVAMVEYFKLLDDVAELNPNTDELNTLTRQVEKLNKTLQRIKERGEANEWQQFTK